MYNVFWPMRFFRNEFGVSDVRSNYSRVYSWLANQLGHVTLGLVSSLLFFWIVTLVESFASILCDSLTAIDVKFIGMLFAVVMFASMVIWIGRRNMRFSILTLMVLFGTVFLGEWKFCDNSIIAIKILNIDFPSASVGATLIVGCSILFAMIGNRTKIRKANPFYNSFNAPFDPWSCLIGSVCLAMWLAGAPNLDLLEDWRVAASSAIASLAVWSAKEFASDMHTVRKELDDAKLKRHSANTQQDIGESLNDDYMRTARWDCRTDTMFYLIGALVGSGLVSDVSVVTGGENVWTFDLEMIGAAAYFVFLVLVGRNWVYRQRAVDKTGAEHANMMAVIDFNIQLHCPYGATFSEPRILISDFVKLDDTTCCPFEHIVVFGKGRHTEPLANALVTEAALTPFSPKWCARISDDRRYRARKISFDRLWHYDPSHLGPNELPYNPLFTLCHYTSLVNGVKCHFLVSEPPRRFEGESWKFVKKIYGAQFVVIMRCDPTRMRQSFKNLDESKKTVWVFEEKHKKQQGSILSHLRYEYGHCAKIGIVTCS